MMKIEDGGAKREPNMVPDEHRPEPQIIFSISEDESDGELMYYLKMNDHSFYRLTYPIRTLAASVALFASGFLFMTPGICGGPGLLGFDGMWTGYAAIALFLSGMAGFVIGAAWFVVAAIVRAARKTVDPEPQTP